MTTSTIYQPIYFGDCPGAGMHLLMEDNSCAKCSTDLSAHPGHPNNQVLNVPEERCGNCRFVRKINSRWFCHRYPPAIHHPARIDTENYPLVGEFSHSCGEYQAVVPVPLGEQNQHAANPIAAPAKCEKCGKREAMFFRKPDGTYTYCHECGSTPPEA